MSAAVLLGELRAAGAELTVDARGIRFRAPRPLSAELLARARALKPELWALLAPPAPAVDQLPPDVDPGDPAAVDLAASTYPRPGGMWPGSSPELGELPPPPASSWAPPPRPAGDHPLLDHLDAIELDGWRRLGPIRGRAPLASPSAAVDPGRAAGWREAYARRLAAGLDPESAARLTCTTHGARPA